MTFVVDKRDFPFLSVSYQPYVIVKEKAFIINVMKHILKEYFVSYIRKDLL